MLPEVRVEGVLLDTHYWIWLQEGAVAEISEPEQAAIQGAARMGRLLLSAISVWELGMLESKGRLRLNKSCDQWVDEALATPGLLLMPLSPRISIDSTRLPGAFHGDPADRIIAATARSAGVRLATRDRALRSYAESGHLRVL
jgi:PIN domain nuclease of toxin-antitoxin system